MTESSPAISWRPETDADESFLFELYASTRVEELAGLNWPEPARAAFLTMQFQAQRQGYRQAFPDAEFSILLRAGRPIGRQVVNRTAAAIHLVDLVLSPECRNQGLGSALFRQWMAEAAAAKKPVRLKVYRGGRPTTLYQRLGFVKIAEMGLYDELEWLGSELTSRGCFSAGKPQGKRHNKDHPG